jgi:hypothetical protein
MDTLETRRLFALAVSSGTASVVGPGFESIDRVLLTRSGDLIVAGLFRNTALSPDVAVASSGDSDAFVARIRADGRLAWVQTFGDERGEIEIDDDRADFAVSPRRAGEPFLVGPSDTPVNAGEYVTALAEGPDGEILVGGAFDGQFSLGGKTLVGNGFYDGFVLRLGAKRGTVIDAWSFGGDFYDVVTDLEVDSTGGFVVSGSFSRRADFDLSPTAARLFEPLGRGDGFVARYSAAGALQWHASFGGDSANRAEIDVVTGIDLDAAGNVAVGGIFSETADFAPGPARLNIQAQDLTDAFTLVLSARGKLAWLAVQSSDDYEGIRDVAFGPAGSVYSVGYFQKELDADPGSRTALLVERGEDDGEEGRSSDLYLNRFNADGSLRWAKSLPGNGYETVAGLSARPDGGVALGGSFYGILDFDPGRRDFTVTTPESDADDANQRDRDNAYAGFVAQYSPNGVFISADIAVGSNEQDVFVSAFARRPDNSAVVVGRFRGRVIFGNGSIDVRTNGQVTGEEDGYLIDSVLGQQELTG